ncbi:MAG: hypothetical protein WEB52_00590 [Dehalococcoidia bacterium]
MTRPSRLGLRDPTAASASPPAFYALRPGAWRDYVTLLHPPYTIWHLSYVVMGAALAPTVHYDRLSASLLAFFLALGLGAHALDELNGRPLQTHIPDRVLRGIAIGGIAGAAGLGGLGVALVSPWLLAFVAFGAFIAPAYNLEWFHGRLHSDLWFAAAWGAFPFLTSYWVNAEHLGPAAGVGAVAVLLVSLVQRVLSKRVREIRRRARVIVGHVTDVSGETHVIDRAWVIATDESALMLLSVALALLSIAMLVARM